MFFQLLVLIVGITIQPHSRIEITTKNIKGDVVAGGSGVVIAKNKVLTAYHVLQGAASATATCNDKEIELKPVISSAQLDLSIVEFTQDCNILPVKLAKENPTIAEDIYAIGYPSLVGFMVTKGVVSSYYWDSKRVPKMWSDTKAWYGNSGGPVLNVNGELVGILQAIQSLSTVVMEDKQMDVNSQQWVSIAPISIIKVFLIKAGLENITK